MLMLAKSTKYILLKREVGYWLLLGREIMVGASVSALCVVLRLNRWRWPGGREASMALRLSTDGLLSKTEQERAIPGQSP